MMYPSKLRKTFMYPSKLRKTFTVCLLGLDGSGKTSGLLRLGGSLETPSSTGWSFNPKVIKITYHRTWALCFPIPRNAWITFYDLGGHCKIRDIWSDYYADSHASIFFIDVSNETRIQEAKTALMLAKDDLRMSGKPILLYSKGNPGSRTKPIWFPAIIIRRWKFRGTWTCKSWLPLIQTYFSSAPAWRWSMACAETCPNSQDTSRSSSTSSKGIQSSRNEFRRIFKLKSWDGKRLTV